MTPRTFAAFLQRWGTPAEIYAYTASQPTWTGQLPDQAIRVWPGNNECGLAYFETDHERLIRSAQIHGGVRGKIPDALVSLPHVALCERAEWQLLDGQLAPIIIYQPDKQVVWMPLGEAVDVNQQSVQWVVGVERRRA